MVYLRTHLNVGVHNARKEMNAYSGFYSRNYFDMLFHYSVAGDYTSYVCTYHHVKRTFYRAIYTLLIFVTIKLNLDFVLLSLPPLASAHNLAQDVSFPFVHAYEPINGSIM